MTMQDEYTALVMCGKMREDGAQKNALQKLELLRILIEKNLAGRKKLLQKIIPISKKSHGIRGVYLYGEVGRGKSMLMDLFFTLLAIEQKKRIHFHAFMLDIHAKLHERRTQNHNNNSKSDPIHDIARNISLQTKVLCFDELQVSDITDAMILGRLFTELFKNGVIIVATSNRHPDELYKDGLQRELFLPFIAMIKEKLEVHSLAAKEDYRLVHLKSLESVYYFPLDNNAAKFMQKAFARLTGDAHPEPVTLNVNGRKLIMPKSCGDILWTNFSELCQKPLGAADYIEIAREFGTVLLEGIPQMGRESRNEAKRFVTLIDTLYEHKVKLIITAATSANLLYVAGEGSFEFARTVSRLAEMQSEQYLLSAHSG